MQYQIQDIDLEEFVRTHALMLTDKHSLRFGLLLAAGDSIEVTSLMAVHNDPMLRAGAIAELVRIGFIREVQE
jgi:hypothetical protein